MGRLSRYLLLFAWVIFIEIARLKAESVKTPGLVDLIDRPEIRLYPKYLKIEDLPSSLKKEPDYESFWKPVLEEIQKENFDRAYVDLSKYLENHPNAIFSDWLLFLKADLLLRVQNRIPNGKLGLAQDEYELAIRLHPLHSQVARALYQVALIKLYSGLYQEAEITAQRAISEYPESALVPDFHLIIAEQAFLARQYDRAMTEFNLIVRKFPRHTTAVDAAFRKAFLHFMQKEYQAALDTYRNLESFHSAEFNILQMKREASAPIKLQDRIFYGESLYLTEKYQEASEVFQNLANLFPKHSNAAFAWIRFGDTFFQRERYLAAQKIYEHVIQSYSDSKVAKVYAKIRLFDALIKTNRIRYEKEVASAMHQAAAEAMEANSPLLAELAQVRLVEYFLRIQAYPKAQRILAQLKKSKEDVLNLEWIQNRYIDVLEKEILDYYQAGDLLAALTTYLVNEPDVSVKFNNVGVLIRIADAARELDLLEKSEEILSRVVYLESSSIARQEALLKLIDILILRKDLRKASERLRRFSFAYPTTSLKYLYDRAWGDLYRSLGNSENAIRHYEEAIKLAKAQPGGIVEIRHSLIRLGELYAKLNLPLKAIESYTRYLDLYSDKEKIKLGAIAYTKKDKHYLTVARYRIADLYFGMKDYIQALGAYRIVSDEVKEEPFLSHALYRIGECYLALNDREAAIEAFRKVRSDDPNNLWLKAAQSYIQSVEMEVKHGIRIFN